ncbi:cysteine hydrolase family protein [Cohaesibacter gelatinilyticus]|uniref:Nicotinamidase-related amidase n=1 Tax=Cohaesibacter gelatinilyticus TaxID=372072 RepID=A0A285NAE7_9HYPH|nr:isochorismatase family cysteine hydrolase [Cohaesibacter gelatinilyticus]SNZ06410.1 Nicotinamidase-related amidase [Cohaesibacter gelatinilyticus]HAT86355.1 cysteine hydrolase [Hyphomicrobiales bacterium]
MDLILGLVLAGIVFLMANGLFKLLNRPKIIRIDPEQRPNTALLVIDMQTDFTKNHDKASKHSAFELINSLAMEKQRTGVAVIEIRHVFVALHEKLFMRMTAGGAGVEGSPGIDRDDALSFQADQLFTKHQMDSFSVPAFESYLDQHKIGHLYITGQEANACIQATANGALARGYEITLVDEGILSADQHKWQKNRENLLLKGARIQ